MPPFIVILAIVAHRLLRFDLVNDTFGKVPVRLILMGALVVAVAEGMFFQSMRLRLGVLMLLQWLLWTWTGVTKLVADGSGALFSYLKDDYAKDVVFATLVSMLCDSVRKLRILSWVMVAVMSLIAIVSIPQYTGVKRCYHTPPTSRQMDYEAKTDNRPCIAAPDCFDVPASEQYLRNEIWWCEHQGWWGLATVESRIHYVGNLGDPNALSLALVMATALGMGLLTWPGAGGGLRRVPRLLLYGALGVMGLGVVLAGSRAGQLAMAVVVLGFSYSRIGVRGVVLAAAAVAPVVLISTRNAALVDYSTVTRLQTQLNGYQAFLDHPLFGIGYANYLKISFLNAHNSLMLAATEAGIPGSAIFLLAAYMAFKFLLQVLRWPGAPEGEEDPESLPELLHLARTLLFMLLGVASCVAFLSLSFDVMWLFPLGIVSAFYITVKDELPSFELHVSLLEVVIALFVGGLIPVVTAAVAVLF